MLSARVLARGTAVGMAEIPRVARPDQPATAATPNPASRDARREHPPERPMAGPVVAVEQIGTTRHETAT
jgi:hypothetical protein